MPAPKTLPQNESPLSKAALKWLMKERVHAPPWELHLLDLAHWGLENKVEGEWPNRERPAVELQVGYLAGWPAADVLQWLFSNPNGPDDPKEQEQDLLVALRGAMNARSAGAVLLSTIYSRQQAECRLVIAGGSFWGRSHGRASGARQRNTHDAWWEG
jgi:hypothetical protein